MNSNLDTNKKDKSYKDDLKTVDTSQEDVSFILEKDRDTYLNSYKPLIKTQYGFNFMTYPQLQFSLIVSVSSLTYYFMSYETRNCFLIILFVWSVRVIMGYIVKNILSYIGVDEINNRIYKF